LGCVKSKYTNHIPFFPGFSSIGNVHRRTAHSGSEQQLVTGAG
jgi:hypothetical protein